MQLVCPRRETEWMEEVERRYLASELLDVPPSEHLSRDSWKSSPAYIHTHKERERERFFRCKLLEI